MQMQEPGQWQSSDEAETSGQEYGAYRAETGYYEQGQKIPPQARRSVLGTLIIIFSAIGFGPATLGIIGSAMVLSKAGGSSYLLTGGVFGLVGSILVLLCLVTIFVLSVVTAARGTGRYRRLRFH